MKMHIGGSWVDKDERIDVLNPYDGSVVDTVPRAEASDIDRALATAVRGAEIMRKLTGYERYKILHKAADLINERAESFAETITLEGGKVKAEALIEVERAAEIIYLSAEEAKRLGSEVIPLDGAPGVTGKFGFTIRVPCGIVAAISPFNFPLHLVCHKIGPGIAAGNAVVLKPATDTPLSGLAGGRGHARSRVPTGSAPVSDRLRRRDRGCFGQRSARPQDHLHRQPRCG